jgi:type I restriction enzyme S subunit
MPKNWKIYKLEELTTKLGDGLHGTPKYSLDGEYYFINGNNLTNGKIEIKENTKRVDKAQYLKYQKPLNDRTIFVSINGTLGNVATYNNEKVVLGKSACYFNINDNVDKVFIKQFVSSPDFKYFLECNATGSVIKNISLKSMREYEIQLPPLPEQTQIANILSAIDDKIENNLAINKTLEDMAMALYKHWFVDFGPFQEGEFVDSELGLIPKGWEVKSFFDMFDLLSGGTPKTSNQEYWNGKFEWVSAKDIGSSGSIYINDTEKKITQLGIDKSATKILPEDTVIVVARGSVGKFGMITKPMCMNQSCYGIYSKSNYSQPITYLLIDSLMKHFLNVAYGSVFDTITTSTFKTINVLVPPKNVMDKIRDEIDVLFQNKKTNIKENQSLTKLRDTLLPKLISGEVRLKEFREGIDAEMNSA